MMKTVFPAVSRITSHPQNTLSNVTEVYVYVRKDGNIWIISAPKI